MVNQGRSDRALIRGALAGDASVVPALYQRHAPVIFRYLFVRVSNRTVAEDLTGEVFMNWVENLPRYVDSGLPVGAWLLGIARARLVDYFRHNRYQPVPSSERLAREVDSAQAAALRQGKVRTLLARFDGLTDEQRLALQLRFIEGHSLQATAGLMQKSITAMKSLQFRALRQLAGPARDEA